MLNSLRWLASGLIGLLAVLASCPAQAGHEGLTLWYAQPAEDWEEHALPIGNGAMGAMVFGGVASERLQFNEKTLWTGGPGAAGYHFGNSTAAQTGAIEEVRKAIDAKGVVDPGWVSDRLGQKKVGFGAYQTFGDLHFDFADAAAPTQGYRRELDIADAIAGVAFTRAGVQHRREYFASYPDHVIAARFSADQPGQVSFTFRYSSQRKDFVVSARDGRLTLRGKLADNGLNFEAQVRVLNEGGTVRAGDDGTLVVSGADSVVLLLAAGTDYASMYPQYRGADPHARLSADIDAAAAKPYSQLRAAHVADHRALFDRLQLDIGQHMPNLPTDALLIAYAEASAPAARAMEQLFFQYGRYLLIASSRAGSLPANLQGVWNHSVKPPWDADYHLNINLQMNYWPVQTTNLAATAEPFTQFVEGLSAPGEITAKQMYNAPGWAAHTVANPWGHTGVIAYATAFWFPEANAWLANQVYDQYAFNRDREFLRTRAYPLLKGASEFWLATLTIDPRDGKLVASPSYSPEQGGFTAGASMSQQIVWELFNHTLDSARELRIDADLQKRLRAALAKLDPGLRIGRWGQLQEWKTDLDDPKNEHRHVSHLYALHPGAQIAPLRDVAFADAAKVSLNARGDGGTGWSKAWKINFWARLRDGDHALKMLHEQLVHSTLPNLFDTHPPFQIDGNFGATAGVAEMLLQSHAGVIDILPALSSAWADGSVHGLRARGDVTVDIEWAQGMARVVTLHAGHDGELRVRSAKFATPFKLIDVGNGRRVKARQEGETIAFRAKAGRVYRVE